ncbi:MAG: hypothetical protein ABI051_15065 [Vicinamibacterales bacterium]
MTTSSWALVVTFGTLGAALAVMAYGTLARNRFGININSVVCPRCTTHLPRTREPNGLRQKLWGGWTCPVCRAEIDKWGRELPNVHAPNNLSDGHREPKRRFLSTLRGSLTSYFAVTMFTGWDFSFRYPSSAPEWLLYVIFGALETAVAAPAIHFALEYLRQKLGEQPKGDSESNGRPFGTD